MMQPQITESMTWFQVDTPEGIFTYPSDFGKEDVAREWDVGTEEIEEVEGHGARLSAPGYLDCTEWAIFDTVEEAREYLVDTYYDDREEDEIREVFKEWE